MPIIELVKVNMTLFIKAKAYICSRAYFLQLFSDLCKYPLATPAHEVLVHI